MSFSCEVESRDEVPYHTLWVVLSYSCEILCAIIFYVHHSTHRCRDLTV